MARAATDRLAVFDPTDRGAEPSCWRPDDTDAERRRHLERSARLRDHGVNRLEELLTCGAARRPAVAEAGRHDPVDQHGSTPQGTAPDWY